MTTFLYLLIAALIFGVLGYVLASMSCGGNARYLDKAPVDPVTEDDGSCEDADAKAAKEAEAAAAQKLLDEEAAQAKAEEAAKQEAEVQAAAEKAAQAKAEAETKAKEDAKKETEAQAAAKIEVPDAAEDDDGVAPEGLLSAPRGGQKDNLTRIKGIGVKIDEALNSIGIYHFDQIAAWTEDNMAWADKALAFPGRAKRDDWVGQAKLLAKGRETEFSQRVDKGEVASSKKA